MNLVEASVACKLAGVSYGQWHYLCEVLGVIEQPDVELIRAQIKRKKSGRTKEPYGTEAARADTPVVAYTLSGTLFASYNSVSDAAAALGKPPRNIYLACGGSYKRAYGLQWRYIDDPPAGGLYKVGGHNKASRQNKRCPICGKIFLGTKRNKYCSEPCARKGRAEIRSKYYK